MIGDDESYRVCPLNRAHGCTVRYGITKLQKQMMGLLSNTFLSEVVGTECDGHRRIIGSDSCTNYKILENSNFVLA